MMSDHEDLRGARRWLLRCTWFLLPIAVFSGFLEWRLRSMPTSYSEKRRHFDERKPEIEVLVLGSSHELAGVAPEAMALPAFNAASSAQSLHYDHAILERYLPQLPRLQAVVVSLSYFSLWHHLESCVEDWRAFELMHWWEVPGRRPEQAWELRNWSRLALYGPPSALRYFRDGFKTDLTEGVHADGWLPYDFARRPLGDSAQAAVNSHHSLMKQAYFEENARLLEESVALASKANVRAVLISLPVTREYSQRIDMSRWNIARGVARTIATKYGVSYCDFSEDARFTDADFADADHLNAAGARHFTRILDTECLEPAVRVRQLSPERIAP